MENTISRDKVRGMFLGIAIGDALGMPVETLSGKEIAEKYGRITNYIRPDGHKWFNGKEAGTWTDDTQLSLVVAESLIAKRGIDLDDLAARHVAELATARNFGWGSSTRESVERLASGIHWSQSGKSDKPNRGFGNGVAMKVAPIGAWLASFADKEKLLPEDLLNIDRLALMTHYTDMAVASAYVHIITIYPCLNLAEPRKDLLILLEEPERKLEFGKYSPEIKDKLADRFELINTMYDSGTLSAMTAQDISKIFGGGTSYVYNSLPLSNAFFQRSPHSIESLFDTVNAGGDTDTNGSIVGSLLGALNGTSIFPKELIDGLWQKDHILNVADRFCDTFRINC